jgi:hypothetical protein
LLESPEATYVVEWSEVTGARTTKTYIAEAREKHAEMHTFIYAPRKVRTFLFTSPATCRPMTDSPQNGWQYIGQQRWSLIDIKPIWHSLIVPVLLPFVLSYVGARRLMLCRLNARSRVVAPTTPISQK